jgi:hypothetical protein
MSLLDTMKILNKGKMNEFNKAHERSIQDRCSLISHTLPQVLRIFKPTALSIYRVISPGPTHNQPFHFPFQELLKAPSPQAYNYLQNLVTLRNIETRWLPAMVGDAWEELLAATFDVGAGNTRAPAPAPALASTAQQVAEARAAELEAALSAIKKKAEIDGTEAAKLRQNLHVSLADILTESTQGDVSKAPTVGEQWVAMVKIRGIAQELMRDVKMGVRDVVRCLEHVSELNKKQGKEDSSMLF